MILSNILGAVEYTSRKNNELMLEENNEIANV